MNNVVLNKLYNWPHLIHDTESALILLELRQRCVTLENKSQLRSGRMFRMIWCIKIKLKTEIMISFVIPLTVCFYDVAYVFIVNLHSVIGGMSRNYLFEAGTISKVKWLQRDTNLQLLLFWILLSLARMRSI